ncbi:MAG: ATP-binding protein [Lachnospiraceae bacterium]|nr:ATP-binding protein [Lachnospiraceae bacterium]
MTKTFNVNGVCRPDKHYMVDLTSRLEEIRRMVDSGAYFTINRARQYGKTTTLRALANDLKDDYIVVSLDFQRMSALSFENEQSFVAAFSEELLFFVKSFPEGIKEKLMAFVDGTARINSLQALFKVIYLWCKGSRKPIVLMIDEVDTATNNQVFLDFLAQLRAAYLTSDTTPTFQSVILAGVYDVRNVKRKIRPEKEHKENSPWNIAADFLVDMSFSSANIAGMLKEYETDWHTGMNLNEMADRIYAYTSGYPYLVSRLCKLIDERIAGNENFPTKSCAWTKAGFLEAVKILINETNPLYQSLIGKVRDYPELRMVLYDLLFTGKPVPYNALNDYMEIAAMFGFIKNIGGSAIISNRVFESVLYNWFMSEEYLNNKMYDAGLRDKNQFITEGHLNVRRILEKFVECFTYLYGDQEETFVEDVGRRYFMLFLKPIINGEGNCYVEAETRNHERTDLVIDYHGEQFIIEMKVWRGNAYNQRGERQLSDYLDYFHLKKGYMLSFNFNKKKKIGVTDILLGDKVLVEAVV